jgi:hypothetical protein
MSERARDFLRRIEPYLALFGVDVSEAARAAVLKAELHGGDAYAALASVLGAPGADPTAVRAALKNELFGYAYGGVADVQRLGDTVTVSVAQEAIERHRRAWPALRAWVLKS